MDSWAKLIGSIAELITSLAWPIVAIYLIYRFGATFRDFVAGIYEGSFKGFGVEATAKRERRTQAVAQADLKSEIPGADNALVLQMPVGSGKSHRLADLVTRAIPPNSLEGHLVLWVDDKPDQNIAEQRALNSYGLNIVTATSTDRALELLREKSFDVIISDLKRGDDQIAGFKFLEELRKRGIRTPVIFYTSTFGPQLETTAVAKGAVGLTNQASDLIMLLNDTLNPNWKAEHTDALPRWWAAAKRPPANPG
jgi:CheY-like chemotaxis protein